jgi:hypothetical protein
VQGCHINILSLVCLHFLICRKSGFSLNNEANIKMFNVQNYIAPLILTKLEKYIKNINENEFKVRKV